MRPRASRRLLLPAAALGAAALAAVGVAAQAADAPAESAAHARGLAIEVRIPGIPGIDGGYVETRSGLARSGGPYAHPGAPQTALAGNTESLVEAAPATTTASASATARLAGVSLLGGLVTADGVAARAVADARDGAAHAGIATTVTGLSIAGTPVPDGVNQIYTLPGVGDVVVGEQVDALHDPLAARSYAVGLHIHLAQDYAGLPAGTEILVGYVDAGAAIPLPVAPGPTDAATTAAGTAPDAGASTATDATSPSSDDPTAALAAADPFAVPTAPASSTADGAAGAAGAGTTDASSTAATTAADTGAARTAADDGGAAGTPQAGAGGGTTTPSPGDRYEVPAATVSHDRDTSATQDAPPGGYTKTPPISAADRANLLSSAYTFPVFGGADFSNDFGGARADVPGGFHQGIDLFGTRGRALLAVHDGVVFRVGWNHLGGNRLWLDDGEGNLFYYAHLQGYAPKLGPLIEHLDQGVAVKRGEVIGFLGDTGDAKGTPTHLHFEIHPNGRWAVPPFEYVTAWLKGGTPLAATPTAITPAATGTAPATTTPPPAATGGAVDEPAATAPRSSDIGDVPGLDASARAEAAGR